MEGPATDSEFLAAMATFLGWTSAMTFFCLYTVDGWLLRREARRPVACGLDACVNVVRKEDAVVLKRQGGGEILVCSHHCVETMLGWPYNKAVARQKLLAQAGVS